MPGHPLLSSSTAYSSIVWPKRFKIRLLEDVDRAFSIIVALAHLTWPFAMPFDFLVRFITAVSGYICYASNVTVTTSHNHDDIRNADDFDRHFRFQSRSRYFTYVQTEMRQCFLAADCLMLRAYVRIEVVYFIILLSTIYGRFP